MKISRKEQVCGLIEGTGKNTERNTRIKGEEKPNSLTRQKLLLTPKTYENNSTKADQIQENNQPSLNKDNGRLVCGTTLEPLEYVFNRKRGRKYTSEQGLAVETEHVIVGRCPNEGPYRTTYPDDIVRNKQYSLTEIQAVLEGKHDYSLSSPRTKSYWKSWYRDMLKIAVKNLSRAVGQRISKEDMLHALETFFKELGECWLRYVLDLCNTGINNLCLFFDLLEGTIGYECGNLHKTLQNGGAETAGRGCSRSPGG